MQPPHWQPPVELSAAEQAIAQRIKRAKLFVFLRAIRHELFDEKLQNELNQMYQDSAVGQPPVPPAQVALTMIIQAYTGASDDEAIEAMTMDRRWQLVLDCLECEQAPFSKATLVRGRQALIQHRLERRLIERTIELAAKTGGFGSRQLRAALDSSPLWGAGRVEDTYNLLGHALKKALGVIAAQQGRELSELASEAGATVVSGSSLKAALDLNWDDPNECFSGLQVVLGALEGVSTWMETQPQAESATLALAAAEQVKAQDVTVNADGTAQLKKGVARNRRISLEDPHMRHGRKSKHQRVDGYKRHILRDLDSGLVPCVGLTPANVPEAWVTDTIVVDLKAQELTLSELHIDRAYLTSKLVRHRSEELAIYCKAWSVRNRQGLFAKTAFTLDWQQNTICCPNGVSIPFTVGKSVQFPAATCASCPLKEQCTTSETGRHVSIHPDERFLQELRQRQLTPQGRAKLRERVAVEHTLAHIAHWQGERARYLTLRKNLFDLRRMAVVHNLHILARLYETLQDAVA
jgi:Transposase DDE domain/Transposase domain (DUF772)